MENLKLWESVEKTDPKHTKQANVKGNKLTSIKPQYQILQATKQWGSYGGKWGFKNISYDTTLVDVNGLIIFKAVFYYPAGEFETINTISIWRDGAMTKADDEWAKKVETDTLTKSLSKLGFNADIFLGRFDDLRYVEEMIKEFRQSTPEEKEALLRISQAKSIDDLTNIKVKYSLILNLIKIKLTEKYNELSK